MDKVHQHPLSRKRKFDDFASSSSGSGSGGSAATTSGGGGGGGGDGSGEHFKDIMEIVHDQLLILSSSFTWRRKDRRAAKGAMRLLQKIGNQHNIRRIICTELAMQQIIKYLEEPPQTTFEVGRVYELEVQEQCCYLLSNLAMERSEQKLIVRMGAVPLLVNLLSSVNESPVLTRALETISILSYENNNAQEIIRSCSGIAYLVKHLQHNDLLVRYAALDALFNSMNGNEVNKMEVVSWHAIPVLVTQLHYRILSCGAVKVITALVESQYIHKILDSGALHPIIDLLSSDSIQTQWAAAHLIYQIVKFQTCYKEVVAKRGVVQPLVNMLQSQEVSIRLIALYVLREIVKDEDICYGIALSGGISLLTKMLETEEAEYISQIIYIFSELASIKDNITEFVKSGAFQKMLTFQNKGSDYYVDLTIQRLKDNASEGILEYLIHLMETDGEIVKSRVALSLIYLCSPAQYRHIFFQKYGIQGLLKLFRYEDPEVQRDAFRALLQLADNGPPFFPLDISPKVSLKSRNENFSMETSKIYFTVEGKRIEANAKDLWDASPVFQNVIVRRLDELEIKNIKADVFEQMLRCIETDSVAPSAKNMAKDLLKLANLYCLPLLKRRCEILIAQDLNIHTLPNLYRFSQSFNALFLRHLCIIFILKRFDDLQKLPRFSLMLEGILKDLEISFKLLYEGTEVEHGMIE